VHVICTVGLIGYVRVSNRCTKRKRLNRRLIRRPRTVAKVTLPSRPKGQCFEFGSSNRDFHELPAFACSPRNLEAVCGGSSL